MHTIRSKHGRRVNFLLGGGLTLAQFYLGGLEHYAVQRVSFIFAWLNFIWGGGLKHPQALMTCRLWAQVIDHHLLIRELKQKQLMRSYMLKNSERKWSVYTVYKFILYEYDKHGSLNHYWEKQKQRQKMTNTTYCRSSQRREEAHAQRRSWFSTKWHTSNSMAQMERLHL